FDTLAELREDMRKRLHQAKRAAQLYSARDKALAELVSRAGIPAPEGVVRDEVEHRKQHLTEELEQVGRSLQEYLDLEEKTEEQVDAELAEAASEGIRVQILLDALAEAEQIQVSDDECRAEIVQRAQRAGMEPQRYYDELVRAGAAGSVFGDIRRSKAIGLVLQRVTITDTAGNPVRVDTAEETTVVGEADSGGDGDGDGDGDGNGE